MTKKNLTFLYLKKNAPFNCFTFFNQSISKKDRQLENQERTAHQNKLVFILKGLIFLPSPNPKTILGNGLTGTVRTAINILIPYFMNSPGIHLKSNFVNSDKTIMNWKYILRNNVKDNFAILIFLCFLYSVAL